MYGTLEEILAQLRAGLEVLYGSRLVHLILYGSQARGEATAESDIDVLVVLQGSVEPGAEIARVGYLTASLSLQYKGIHVKREQLPSIAYFDPLRRRWGRRRQAVPGLSAWSWPPWWGAASNGAWEPRHAASFLAVFAWKRLWGAHAAPGDGAGPRGHASS
jgi:predicted nucleotidyltransferase